MPDIKMTSEEEFAKKSIFLQEVPVGAHHLAYEIRIPKEWKRSDTVSLGSLVVSDRIFSDLARYNGPVTTGVKHHILVQAKGVTYQMTAKHWFVKYIMENGYNVRGLKEYDAKRVDALYVYINEGITYVVRAAIQINGKDLIFVQHIVPIEDWSKVAVEQAHVINSFKIRNKNDEPIEDMTRYRMLDIAELLYPASWTFEEAPVRSVDRLSAHISRADRVINPTGSRRKKWIEKLIGEIGFDAISVFASKDVDEEIEKYKMELTDNGLYVQEELEDHTEMVAKGTDLKLETHVFSLVDKHSALQEYEFWLTVTAYGNHFYYTTMLTPTRGNDFLEWSRNTQMYRSVVQTFKAQETEKNVANVN